MQTFDSVKLGNFDVGSSTPTSDELVHSIMLSSLRDVAAKVSLGDRLLFECTEGSLPIVLNVHVSRVVETNSFPSFDRSVTLAKSSGWADSFSFPG